MLFIKILSWNRNAAHAEMKLNKLLNDCDINQGPNKQKYANRCEQYFKILTPIWRYDEVIDKFTMQIGILQHRTLNR